MVKLVTPHEPLPESEFASEDSSPEVELSATACLRRTHRINALHVLLMLPLLKTNCRILKPNGSLAVPLIPRSANKSMASKQESPKSSQRFDTAMTLRSKEKKEATKHIQQSIVIK